MTWKAVCSASFLAFLSACAVLPDATITYYLPKSETTIGATQTVACDMQGTLTVMTVLNAKPVYAADYGRPAKPLHLKSLDSKLSDTDVSVTLTDDGRLKNINSTQTGQAEAAIKEAVTVAAEVATVAALTSTKWCDGPNKDKPVTISYSSGPLSYSQIVATKPVTMNADAASAGLYDVVSKSTLNDKQIGEKLRPTVVIHAAQLFQTVTQEKIDNGVEVTLPIMKRVTIEMFAGITKKESVGTQDILLPSEETPGTFSLFIAPSAKFGTQKFILSIADAGNISSIEYSKNTGATSALTAGQDVLSVKSDATADRIANLKAQGDLIAAQTRLAVCKTDSANCK